MTTSRESLSDAYEVLRRGGVLPWPRRARIAVRGRDRAAFLHSFCTNDIKRLTVGQTCEAFFCQAQGRIVGHGFIECQADQLVIDTVAGQAAPLIGHLDRYLIREDVQLVEVDDATPRWLFSGAAGTGLSQIEKDAGEAEGTATKTELAGRQVTMARCPWEAEARSFLVASATDDPLTSDWANAVCQRIRDQARCDGGAEAEVASGAFLLDETAFELWRIMHVFPLYGRDITTDNLPQEVGRDARAISFNKGCYLGQEPVARIDSLGHVNWELVSVIVPGAQAVPPWTPGSVLTAGDKPALRLTSVIPLPALRGLAGLGYVRRELRRLARPQLSCPVAEGVLVTSAGDVLLNPSVFSS
ncbi:MAG: hypothetical protein U0935_00610 [Pirellulales bacterium]